MTSAIIDGNQAKITKIMKLLGKKRKKRKHGVSQKTQRHCRSRDLDFMISINFCDQENQ